MYIIFIHVWEDLFLINIKLNKVLHIGLKWYDYTWMLTVAFMNEQRQMIKINNIEYNCKWVKERNKIESDLAR